MTEEPKSFMTLNEYIEKVQKNFDASAEAEKLMRKNMFNDMSFYGYTPATRWQKFKYKFRRIKDAWDVLRGNKDVE